MSKVIRVYRSWRSIILRLLLCGFIGALGKLVGEHTSVFDAQLSLGNNVGIQLPLYLLLFLVLLARPLILIFDSHFDISEHHLRYTFGKCSTHLKEVCLPIEEIRGVRIDQSIFERMLGIGSVFAWTHAGSNPEIRVSGIINPSHIASEIMTRIDKSQIDRKTKDGSQFTE